MSTARIPDGTPQGPRPACRLSRNKKGWHSVGWFYGVACEWCGEVMPLQWRKPDAT